LRIRELKDFARHESPATGGVIGAFLGELLPNVIDDERDLAMLNCREPAAKSGVLLKV
jgi:hypothetical protein